MEYINKPNILLDMFKRTKGERYELHILIHEFSGCEVSLAIVRLPFRSRTTFDESTKAASGFTFRLAADINELNTLDIVGVYIFIGRLR